jgi:hypothetical protein
MTEDTARRAIDWLQGRQWTLATELLQHRRKSRRWRDLQSLLSSEGSQRSRISFFERSDQARGNGCRQYLPGVYCAEVDPEFRA